MCAASHERLGVIYGRAKHPDKKPNPFIPRELCALSRLARFELAQNGARKLRVAHLGETIAKWAWVTQVAQNINQVGNRDEWDAGANVREYRDATAHLKVEEAGGGGLALARGVRACQEPLHATIKLVANNIEGEVVNACQPVPRAGHDVVGAVFGHVDGLDGEDVAVLIVLLHELLVEQLLRLPALQDQMLRAHGFTIPDDAQGKVLHVAHLHSRVTSILAGPGRAVLAFPPELRSVPFLVRRGIWVLCG
mmetsp:Transcript_26379/g.83852  ORF Transcript_26379/g.83852 Transcript_26379/m.83852 type:complete len:251 (-) Transcript_26379:448-1200(-)